jgi:DNA polymerase
MSRRADALADDSSRTIRSLGQLREAVNQCRRCPLWRDATQGVPGEGRAHAKLMLVGEQPGDQEDLKGAPFVGPAGALLNRALEEAGIQRQDVYVTNAVKHFKYEQRGRRRLHSKPNAGEITACRWWLTQELRLIEPRMVVALGATAARSLLGKPVTISRVRGTIERLGESANVLVTVHPSYLLRIPEENRKQQEFRRFVGDLRQAQKALLVEH